MATPASSFEDDPQQLETVTCEIVKIKLEKRDADGVLVEVRTVEFDGND